MNRLLITASTALLLLTCGCMSKSAKMKRDIRNASQTMVEKASQYAKEAKFADALEILNKSLAFDPCNENAYIVRSSIYLTQNKLKEAIDDSNSALKINKRNEYGYVNRAHALLYVDQLDQAIEDCDNALKVNPEFYAAYVHRGIAFYRKNELREAIRDLTIALDKLPENQQAHPLYIRSLCYEKMGKEKLATQDLNDSRKLGYVPVHGRFF